MGYSMYMVLFMKTRKRKVMACLDGFNSKG